MNCESVKVRKNWSCMLARAHQESQALSAARVYYTPNIFWGSMFSPADMHFFGSCLLKISIHFYLLRLGVKSLEVFLSCVKPLKIYLLSRYLFTKGVKT